MACAPPEHLPDIVRFDAAHGREGNSQARGNGVNRPGTDGPGGHMLGLRREDRPDIHIARARVLRGQRFPEVVRRRAQDEVRADAARGIQGQIVFTEMDAVGARRQRHIHAVINDEERPVRLGAFAKSQGARMQFAIGAVFFAKLHEPDPRLEDRVEHGQGGPAIAERLRDHHIEIRAGKPAHSFGEEHYPPPTNCTSSTVSPSSRRTEV